MNRPKTIYPIRYYAIGHSYLLHGPFVGWQTCGFWGMAASKPETDYFHRVQQRLQAMMPCTVDAIAENYATYERLCTLGATVETYRNSEEYAQMRHQLRTFRPNLITLYIGGGNTIANDLESLTLFYHTLYTLVAENKPEDATVVCVFSNRKTLFAIDIAKSYGFVPVEMMALHEKGKTPENPYYALADYPEYDEAVKNGAIEFRTHPSDAGHDLIAAGIAETAALLLRQRVKTVQVSATEQKAEDTNEKTVQQSEKESAADCWDFDTPQDVFAVCMGGFNVRCENSIAQVSSAPGTGAAVYHDKLQLPMEQYKRFFVRMKLDCEQPEKGILLQVFSTEGTHECLVQLPGGTMGELTLPLPEGEGTITGFRIEPQMTDCCIYVDRIAFE